VSTASVAPLAARPARVVNLGDRSFVGLLTAAGLCVFAVAGVILFVVWHTAQPAAAKFGLGFVTGSDWDPVQESFGALPFIYGTLVTSALALVVAVPVSLGMSLFVTEMAPKRLRAIVAFALELLAGIPSVVYGLWGIFVLVPWLRESLEPLLGHAMGFS
jgi:phosphate transport system permease protein